MIIYIIYLLIFIYLSYTYDIKKKTKDKKVWLGVSFLMLVMMAGLRYHIGVDSYRYERSFYNETPNITVYFRLHYYEDSEFLWTFLMVLVKTITGSFVAFQFIHAIILNGLIYNFLRKTTDKVFTAILITYCTYWTALNFEVLREAICVGIFINALFLLYNKKIFAYIIVALIAFGLHRFSFVMFIIAPILIYANKRMVYVFLSVLAVYVLFFMDETVLKYILLISVDDINESASEKLMKYVEGSSKGGFRSINIFGYIELIITNAAFPILILLYEKESKYYSMFFKFILLFVVFSFITAQFGIVYRLLNYLGLIVIVVAVNFIFDKSKLDTIRYLVVIFLVLTVLIKIKGFYSPSELEFRNTVKYDCRYFPYKTIFEEPDETRENMFRGLNY